MAAITLGIGTSHGPMMTIAPEQWSARIPFDRSASHWYRGRTYNFDELVTERANEDLAAQIVPAELTRRQRRCRAALTMLAERFDSVAPAQAVIFGNDQREIFRDSINPALAVFTGAEIVNSMYGEERIAGLAPGVSLGISGHIPPEGAVYRGSPAVAEALVASLNTSGFEMTTISAMPHDETPHAYGFVYRQVMGDAPVPTVPVIINTFYPPNQPTARRCYELGRAVARAIAALPASAGDFALFASGGLSHFVIDEAFDHQLLDALERGDAAWLTTIDESLLQAGTSEVKSWIALAGAMREAGLAMRLIDYVPCYRSEAGTGNAMAFVEWC
ncbi:MAG: protocatechuate 3,4-dioxygenase [Pseudomonadota bacterium]